MKKRRTAAQKRATAKMIRANKARRKGKRRSKRNPLVISGKKVKARKVRRGRKKVLRVTGGHLRVKRVKKGHRTAHRKGRAKKKTARKAARRSGGGLTKRQRAARKAARTRKHNAEMRSARARKAARAKKRGKSGGGHRAKKKSSHRRKKQMPAHMRAELPASQMAYESGRRRRHRRAKRNPIPNPIPLEGGLDFFSGLFAVTLGYIFASGADRFAATHALTSSSTQGGFVDAPAAGQIYNSESPSLPIWSSPMRLLAAAASMFVPLGLSAVIKSRGPKSFFQLWSFAAIARTVGKAADDGLSMGLKSTSFGLRLYSPEMAAAAKLTSVGTTAPNPAAPGLFAGVPQQPQIARPQAPPAPTFSALPEPAFRATPPPAIREVAGAPGGLPMDRYESAPRFNPFAETDPDRRFGR